MLDSLTSSDRSETHINLSCLTQSDDAKEPSILLSVRRPPKYLNPIISTQFQDLNQLKFSRKIRNPSPIQSTRFSHRCNCMCKMIGRRLLLPWFCHASQVQSLVDLFSVTAYLRLGFGRIQVCNNP